MGERVNLHEWVRFTVIVVLALGQMSRSVVKADDWDVNWISLRLWLWCYIGQGWLRLFNLGLGIRFLNFYAKFHFFYKYMELKEIKSIWTGSSRNQSSCGDSWEVVYSGFWYPCVSMEVSVIKISSCRLIAASFWQGFMFRCFRI